MQGNGYSWRGNSYEEPPSFCSIYPAASASGKLALCGPTGRGMPRSGMSGAFPLERRNLSPSCDLPMRIPSSVSALGPWDAGGPGFQAAGAFPLQLLPRARSTFLRLGPAFFTARFTLAFDFPVFFASYFTS